MIAAGSVARFRLSPLLHVIVRALIFAALCCWQAPVLSVTPAAVAGGQLELTRAVSAEGIAGVVQAQQAALHSPAFLIALYERRAWRPIWTDEDAIVALRDAIDASPYDGLVAGELARLPAEDPFSPAANLSSAEREVLLTDRLLALGDRLVNGRADPRGLGVDEGVAIAWRDAEHASLDLADDFLEAGDIPGLLAAMRPTTALYQRLRTVLRRELANLHPDPKAIDALRINLERARWFDRALGDRDRVIVNIPAFSLELWLDDERVWSTRVVVGKAHRRTPVFVSEMRDVVLDPTWTVPRSLIEETLFDEARTDPQGFAQRGFRLRDQFGSWHSPTDIDWAAYHAAHFPFDVVQMPGTHNALGNVKFMFDNPYAVYLHDTPARGLFDEASRAFSHGCVRVEHPEELARRILEEGGGLDAEGIASLRAESDNIAIDLLEPLMVGLLYWTVDVDADGRLVHFEDIYGRDALILQGIEHFAPPRALARGA